MKMCNSSVCHLTNLRWFEGKRLVCTSLHADVDLFSRNGNPFYSKYVLRQTSIFKSLASACPLLHFLFIFHLVHPRSANEADMDCVFLSLPLFAVFERAAGQIHTRKLCAADCKREITFLFILSFDFNNANLAM